MGNPWFDHLKKYWKDRRIKDPTYSYKQAMKDAYPSYHKTGPSTSPAKTATTTKARKIARKGTRKGKKMRGGDAELGYSSIKDSVGLLQPSQVALGQTQAQAGGKRKGKKGKKSKKNLDDVSLSNSMAAGGKKRKGKGSKKSKKAIVDEPSEMGAAHIA